jgi:hypothetical protein|tara:strand:+ start:2241 stop:2426 length:186 start_codon:yes stop_codon:yes gene_type:complete
MKSKGGKNKMARTRQDQVRRSKQNWERGRGAKRKGNPRYKPKRVKGKDDVIRKIYVLRGRK